MAFRFRPDGGNVMPARIQTALRVLDHTYCLTHRDDSTTPERPLSPLEKSVETAALRVLQSYLLCEMDYGDTPPNEQSPRPDDNEGTAQVPVTTP